MRIIERSNIIWLVYPLEGDDYYNFLDFELVERPSGGVTFNLRHYGRSRTPDAELAESRASNQQLLVTLGTALKEYLESNS